MDLDSDQSAQIERFYQQCCTQNTFGHKLRIVGDQGNVQNGFHYEVWGDSSDPSTWLEKNTRYTTARQLHRYLMNIEVDENVNGRSAMMDFGDKDDEEVKQNPVTFASPPSE